jgi:DNA-binding response OmpR family regulator
VRSCGAASRARRALPDLPDELRFGDVEIDFRSYEARRNGAPVEMTRKEFAMLRFLASRAGEVVTRDDLLNEVWGFESYPSSRTVDNHVAGLRAKLERDASQPEHIRRYTASDTSSLHNSMT